MLCATEFNTASVQNRLGVLEHARFREELEEDLEAYEKQVRRLKKRNDELLERERRRSLRE